MPILRRLMTIAVALIVGGCQAAPAGTVAPTSSGPAATTVVTPSVPATGSPAGSAVALPTAPPVSLLVDTDGAPDDLVAISFLVAAPNVELAAITVSGTGEVHCPRGEEVILGRLERLQAPSIPVSCGDDRPTALEHAFPDLFRANADSAAGLDLPPTTRTPSGADASDVIASTLLAEGARPLRILTLGPLTNLAQALGERELSQRIEAVYMMGGAVDVPGNIGGAPGGPQDNTTAEWNAFVDPAALASVLAEELPIRLVSLDGTNQVPLTPTFADRVTNGATRRGDGPPNASYMTRADAATIEALLLDVMNRS